MAIRILSGGYVDLKIPREGIVRYHSPEGKTLGGNNSEKPVVLYKSYGTVDGPSDRIVVNPGETICYEFTGNPREFARAVVGSREEVLEYLKISEKDLILI